MRKKPISQFDSIDKRSRLRLSRKKLRALHKQVNQANEDLKTLEKQRERIADWRDDLVGERNATMALIAGLENTPEESLQTAS